MVIITALPAECINDQSRIRVDESDYRGGLNFIETCTTAAAIHCRYDVISLEHQSMIASMQALLEDEQPPFEIKDDIKIRENEKFSRFYECMDELGEGKFGKVYRCREKATSLQLAAKRIKIKRDADREKVEREVKIMTQLRHPRIAQIYDAFSTIENDIVLVMEIVSGGELFDRVVDENYILTEMAVVMIVCQLCEAISYIHGKNIVHLDIKPENIMCVSQAGNRIKLIDFGLAQFYDGTSNLLFMAGTPEFVAPEVIKFEPIDFYTDMWSIGVITYILLSGISPFLGETLGDTYVAVEKGEWEFDEEAFEFISDAAKDFVSKLLIMDQKRRMLPEECLRHPWIVGSREKSVNGPLLNEPNIFEPLPKANLKSYIRNKRFRKAAWALVFLMRFKRQRFGYIGGGVRDITVVSEESAQIATTHSVDMHSSEIPKMHEVVVTHDASDTAEQADHSADIQAFVNICKHAEKISRDNTLSSEIPKKKPKPSTSDDGLLKKEKKKKVKCVIKRQSSDQPGTHSQLEKELSPSVINETIMKESNDRNKNRSKMSLALSEAKKTPSNVEMVDQRESNESAKTSEKQRPDRNENRRSAKISGEFDDILKWKRSKFERQNIQENTDESKKSGKRAENNEGRSSSQLSEINKKGTSVAAILSMFSEKAMKADTVNLRRKTSRQVKTFRDVFVDSEMRKLSAANNANEQSEESSELHLYKADEHDKMRAMNLIALHELGSVDDEKVDRKEIDAIRSTKLTSKARAKGVQIENAANETADTVLMSVINVTESSSNLLPISKAGQSENSHRRRIASTDRQSKGSAKNEKQQGKQLDVSIVVDGSMKSKSLAVVKQAADEKPHNDVVQRKSKKCIETDVPPATDSFAVSKVKLRKVKSDRPSSNTLGNSPTVNGKQIPDKLCHKKNTNTERSLEVMDEKSGTPMGASELNKRVKMKLKSAEKITTLQLRATSPFELFEHLNVQNEAHAVEAKVKDTRRSLKKQATIGYQRRPRAISPSKKRTESLEIVDGDLTAIKKKREAKKSDEKLGLCNQTEQAKGASLAATQYSCQSKYNSAVGKNPQKMIAQVTSNESMIDEKSLKGSVANEINDHKESLKNMIQKVENQRANISMDSAYKLRRSASCKNDIIQRKMNMSLPLHPVNTSEYNQESIINSKIKAKKPPRALSRVRRVNVQQEIQPNISDQHDHRSSQTVKSPKKQLAFESKSASKRNAQFVDSLQQNSPKSITTNGLIKTRSVVNLPSYKPSSVTNQTSKLRQSSKDDSEKLDTANASNSRIAAIANLKKQENFSFGWLKLQLETRVNRKDQDSKISRSRNEIRISPFQAHNAQRALNLWKQMEQKTKNIE